MFSNKQNSGKEFGGRLALSYLFNKYVKYVKIKTYDR